MRPDEQIALAEALRAHRQRLNSIAQELAERGLPLSELEARLITEDAELRLAAVEDALRRDVNRRKASRAPALGRVGRRLYSWTKPRIGVLRHYEPRPIRVPARYPNERAPNNAPTISIVTPSYQQGQFIDKTLYSVVNQKYPVLEYVVQDGGSTDETVAILRRFEPLLSVWTSEPDGGQGEAVNRGFQRTTGEIMAWLNSDDLLLPGSLAYVARYFARHPDVDVLYGNRVMIDQSDRQVGAWILPAHSDEMLTLADYVPQETLFWRRQIWESTGGYVDPSFHYALDWDLLLRFREAGAKIVHVPRFLGAFRIHDEQKTTALYNVGESETDLLRLRVHGRELPMEEVLERLRPYFFRHILVHTRQRFVDRLPWPRAEVMTEPAEPWLKTPPIERQTHPVQPHDAEALISPLGPPAPGTPLPDGSVVDEYGHPAGAG